MNTKLNAAAGKILEALKLIEAVKDPGLREPLEDIKQQLPILVRSLLDEGIKAGIKLATKK